MKTRQEILIYFGRTAAVVGAGIVGGMLVQPNEVKAAGPADRLSEDDVALLQLLRTNRVKVLAVLGITEQKDNATKRVGEIPDWPETIDDEKIKDYILSRYRVKDTSGYPNAFSEQEWRDSMGILRNKDTKVIYGVTLAPERLPIEHNIERGYLLINPGPAMQNGQIADVGIRSSCGLTLAEATALNWDPQEVTAGIPVTDKPVLVWGATLFQDQTEHYGKLQNQTMAQRCSR